MINVIVFLIKKEKVIQASFIRINRIRTVAS